MNNLSIKQRLTLLIGFMAVLLVTIGVVGLRGMAQGNELLRDALDDRRARELLARIDHTIMDSRIHVGKGRLGNDPAGMIAEAETVAGNIALLRDIDQRFLNLDPDADSREQAAVQRYAKAVQSFITATLEPSVAALRTADHAALARLWDGGAGAYASTYAPVKESAAALTTSLEELAAAEYQSALDAYSRARWLGITTILGGVILGGVFGLLLIRSIGTSLARVRGQIARISGGDLEGQDTVTGSHEVAEMERDLADMRQRLRAMVQEVHASASRIGEAVATLGDVSGHARGVIARQGDETGAVAIAMERVLVAVGDVSDHVAAATRSAGEAEQESQVGRRVVGESAAVITRLADGVQEAAQAIGRVASGSEEIVRIVDVITGIAEQTNLRRSRRPAPVRMAAALRWWLTRCAPWPTGPKVPHAKSSRWWSG